MGKLYLIRHADAGHRRDHDGADERRPLSPRGQRQATALAEQFAHNGITVLLASPFLRCEQTLAPLAQRLDLPVQSDPCLTEGAGAAGALATAETLRHTNAAFCSHGDVIPDVLDALLAQGLKIKDDLRWQKASTWVLAWDAHRITKGHYLPPSG